MSRPIKTKFQEERIIPLLQAKNESQRKALKAFTQKQVVVLSGSAGSGKSLLACWWAAKQWREGSIDTIVITRPYQALGKDTGSLPGDDFSKNLPFCMSMLMKFKHFLGPKVLENALKTTPQDFLFKEVSGINIIPIEKIQGLSFNNKTLIICDEAQNSSPEQMKALLTRLEEGCQLIITGDKVQSAIKGKNGLSMLEEILTNVLHPDIAIISFTPEDNCRSGVSGWFANIFEQDRQW